MTAATDGPYSLAPAPVAGVVSVHVPRTGGTAVAHAPYGTDGVGHRTALDLQDALGHAWAEAFTFAVVREPVDRLASAFRYLKAGGSNRLDAAFGARVLAPYSTLDSFVLDWLTPQASQSQVHFRPQTDLACDAAGPPRPAPALSDAARERVAEVYAADFDRLCYRRP